MKQQMKRRGSPAGQSPAKVFRTRAQPRSSWFSQDWFLGLLLVLAVFLVYQPVWYAGYLWDDDHHLTANPVIVGPLGLKEIWTTQAAMICPLVLTTFWVEHALWGLAPLPYHLVNVLMHGACGVVLWRLLRSLQAPGAWLGAALWALHPVQVESAAYVTELKNTQSGLFYLLTILFYVKGMRAKTSGDSSGDARYYALTLLFAALAIASKFSTVVLPAVLGLCAWWVEGRWHWRHLVRLAPILLMSAIAVAITMAPRPADMTRIDIAIGARTWPERLATAGDVGWFYLGKLFWPHPLMFVYPLWKIDARTWFSFLPLLALIGALIFLWFKRESRFRPCFFALAYFLVVVSPFLGFIDEDFWTYSYVEDHLQYLASMGPLALAGAGISRLPALLFPARQWLQPTLGAAALVILGLLSWQRAWVFQSNEALWNDTLAKNPDCPLARTNLGTIYLDRQQFDDALAQFQKVLEAHPTNATATLDLGMVYLQTGQVDKAIEQFRRTVDIAASYPLGHYNLGVALLQKGQIDEAIAEFEKALALNSNDAAASNDLATAFLKKGQLDKAIAQYQRTLEIDPHSPSAHYNLGVVLLASGQLTPAIDQLHQDLEINPQHAEAYYQLATASAQSGQLDEAVQQYEKALQIKPDYADAHYNLGVAFLQKGEGEEASAQFTDVLNLNPQDKDAENNLAKAQAMTLQDAARH
jgi:protein O-mannosyl-transferase